MIIFQFLIGVVFLGIFLTLLFFVAWYIVLPLFIIVLGLAFFGRIWEKISAFFAPAEPVEKLVQTHRRRAKKNEVIDVDYTEV